MDNHSDNGHDHGHGNDKSVTIIVNAREKEWGEKRISYIEVIKLAFGDYVDNPDTEYTVAYSKGHGNGGGTLTKGESVNVKDRMVFNVNRTDKS